MKNNIDLTKMNKEEFIYFLMNNVNNYLLNELIPIFKYEQDLEKWRAVTEIVDANIRFYSLFYPYDLSKVPMPNIFCYSCSCS